MLDYSNGKIYKLWSPQGDDIYIGSTTQSLAKRKQKHKTINKCSAKILFEKYDDVRIELIEEYPCKNKMELNRREGEHIRNNNCVNKFIAGRTYKEWVEDNKEHRLEYQKLYNKEYSKNNKEKLLEYHKEYRENNKEKILEKMREKITCECGCEITRTNLTRHNLSKKHINFIQQQQASQESQVLN